jgi:hypothetical protein
MERKDADLFKKITDIATKNNEIIARIKSKTSDIVIGYKYSMTNAYNSKISNRDNISVYKIVEEKITKKVSDILASWCPKEELNKIKDFFNDKLDYTCNNLGDVVRLNIEMESVAKKYDIFDCTESALGVIKSFLTNLEILQAFLRELEKAFQDAPSSLDILNKTVNQLNENLKDVATGVVKVNEEEEKQRENKKEEEKKREIKKKERELLSKYPGYSLEKAKEEANNLLLKETMIVKHFSIILSWLGERQLKLIYKGTRDGFGAANFHQKCDNQGETLTVIRSKGSYIFGGYTPISWSSREAYASDKRTFIFTLINPHNIPPTKFANTNQNSIYDGSSYGPYFGPDLIIANQCNASTSSNSSFPNFFADTTGKSYNIFTGSQSFQVEEIEVFTVI